MLSAFWSRRDPQEVGNGISNQKGFTVTELMVAVAVVAIITSLAFPSYRLLIEKRQVTSGAEQVAAFLSAVQIESVMRNEQLTVFYDRQDAGDWCFGIMDPVSQAVNGDGTCDCKDPSAADACEVAGEPRLLSNANLTYPEVVDAMTDDGGNFTYDPVRGVLANPADTLEVEFSSDDDNFALNVQVGPTGRVRTCSDASDTAVPGYQIC